MKHLQFLIPALLLGSAMAVAQPLEPVQSLDEIVAVVEEDVVLRSELATAVDAVRQQFAAQGRPLPPQEILERQVLERLIVTRLQVQRAEATGIRVSEEEIDRAIDRVATQSGLNRDQMRVMLERDNMSWGEFRKEMREEIMMRNLRERVANSRVDVSETDVDMFLASDLMIEGEYLLSHILIGVSESASPAEVDEAERKIVQILQQLESGSDFGTLAVTYSDGTNALQGGELGWRKADQLPPGLAAQLEGLEPGQIAQPIRSPSGYHLLKVEDVRANETKQMVDEVNARHLMIEVNELVSNEEALDQINDYYQRISGGESFEELARKYSDDATSANLGGDLGWFPPAVYGSKFEEVLGELGMNELSAPFRTNMGWHILRLEGEREQDRTEEYVRNQARERLREQKAEEAVALWLRELRNESYVENRLAPEESTAGSG